jgi:hypothetical protein
MTVVTDSRHRITLREAKPGQAFDVQIPEEGKYILTKLVTAKSGANKAHLIRGKAGYLVAVSERPVTQDMVRAALDDFP